MERELDEMDGSVSMTSRVMEQPRRRNEANKGEDGVGIIGDALFGPTDLLQTPCALTFLCKGTDDDDRRGQVRRNQE